MIVVVLVGMSAHLHMCHDPGTGLELPDSTARFPDCVLCWIHVVVLHKIEPDRRLDEVLLRVYVEHIFRFDIGTIVQYILIAEGLAVFKKENVLIDHAVSIVTVPGRYVQFVKTGRIVYEIFLYTL